MPCFWLKQTQIKIKYHEDIIKNNSFRFFKNNACIFNFSYTRISHDYSSIITNFSNYTMDELAEQMLTRFPKQEIVISGPQTKSVTIKNKRLTLLNSMNELIGFCNTAEVI